MTRSLRILAAATAFCALGSIGGASRTQPLRITSISPDSVGLSRCPSPTPDPRAVVRILIREDLSAVTRRRVRYRIYPAAPPAGENDIAAYHDPQSHENRGSVPEYANNPYHVDLTTMGIAASGGYDVKIRVVLLNEDFKFLEQDRDTPDHKIVGVAVQKGSAEASWLCQIKPAAPAGGDLDTITFFAKAGQKGEASLNLMLIARGRMGAETPIIIDPKIKNNG